MVQSRSDLLFEIALRPGGFSQSTVDPLPALVVNHTNVGSAETRPIERQILVDDNEDYESGLHKRDWMFAGLDGRQIVTTYAFVLFETASKSVLGVPQDVPLITNCFTKPEWRGQRLYPRMLRRVCIELARAGHTQVAISCAADNVPSIRGIERAGFTGVARVTCLRVLSKIVVLRRVASYESLNTDSLGREASRPK